VSGPYRTTLTGPFPRTEPLVQATRDLDRGRIPADQAEAAFSAAEAQVRNVETELQLDATTGGYLRWADLFRPFSQVWSGVTVGPLTRFFETNTFFRQPMLDAPPTSGRGGLAGWLPRGKHARAILPGPFTFASLADVRYTPKASAIVDLGSALARELAALGAERPGHVQFQEPMFTYAPPTAETPHVIEAYRALAASCRGSTTTVWTYFGDVGPALPTLAQLPVDVIGFDLFGASVPAGARLAGKGLGAGCIDPTTTIPEDAPAVAELVRAAERSLGTSGVWLGPNPPLDLLPFDSAVAKLRLLPRLKELLAR
jgi:5-methyltetrahydropteroyltriglutamate--homocysteine methyltransferase